ncbi:transcriptional regulator, TrmB [Paracidovorax avenae ATCC 19860]|uniref:Transcriptional regulator, TrmB n=1 Tax=Paracidovorax avenae (strain ATCC 19860 / DSM 7227 / CCUG 15838 / JCM 20985 / LMG 2117 / NCPPB 1011) TaxID=643561 RepID=F0Q9H8_PARA1|nr:Lrp/AsnC family transcriptional regulator [Paracidovorax avenae]ADX44785.1 transcriptional regulator, TrmB [Paracidovorax avenae ATCC 19860]AVS64596.1 Lrp/AsnC family transcriptional regulator [Paracidovorax avenae]
MDHIDRNLLVALHQNAKTTVKALSERVGLSQPSCAERIKRLVERGVIEKFSIQLSPKAVGFPISAIVRVRPFPGEVARVEQVIRDIGEIVQCDKVTGEDAFFCRLHLRSIEELDHCLGRIAHYATTSTSIVRSMPVANRLPPLGGPAPRTSSPSTRP